MKLSERQNNILELLKEKRNCEVRALSESLFVSEATIRRDLTELQKLGLIERTHGGAVLEDNAEEISIFVRMNENSKEKELAATNALPNLPEFSSVFVDSSSTALALAERMDLSHKTVVTNNLQTAMRLSNKKDINLIILGGSVQYNTVSATGSVLDEIPVKSAGGSLVIGFNCKFLLDALKSCDDGEVIVRMSTPLMGISIEKAEPREVEAGKDDNSSYLFFVMPLKMNN